MNNQTNRGLIILLTAGGVLIALILFLSTRNAPTDNPVISAPPTLAAAPTQTLFTIDSAASEASFTLSELLRGQPTTVVGRTNLVSGQLAVDFNDLSTVQMSPIQIEAYDLQTDSRLRDEAIHTRILYTNQFPVIEFVPQAYEGLPTAVSVGDTLNFTISGDVTITGLTRSESFDVTITAVSPTRLEGTATTQINRTDYELVVPAVASIANVDEVVTLALSFTAVSTP